MSRARLQGAVERQLLGLGFDAPFDKLRARSWRANFSARRMVHYVYILRCANSNLYVGSTHNLQARLKAHNDGRGAAYTFKHRPVRLVYSEAYPSETDALKRERQVKRWSRGKKQTLIQRDLKGLKHLSRRNA